MIEAILLSWIALALLTAAGFHLTRRHWIRVQEEARWRHPVWRPDSSMYDQDESDER